MVTAVCEFSLGHHLLERLRHCASGARESVRPDTPRLAEIAVKPYGYPRATQCELALPLGD